MASLDQFLPNLALTPEEVAATRQPLLPQSQPGVFKGGLSAGVDMVQSLGGSALAAVGKATGAEGLEASGLRIQEKNDAEMMRFGRPDLEINPWDEGGPSFLPWLGYQAVKQVPRMGATAVGATAGALAAPVVGVGGAIGAGVAGLLAGTTLGAGSIYSEAVDRGDATREDALKSLALGVPYGALELLNLGVLGKTAGLGFKALTKEGAKAAAKEGTKAVAKEGAKQATKRSALSTISRGVLANTATEATTEALQTSLEMTVRPDLTSAEKADNIVNAALVGGILGGTFGGVAGGVKAIRTTDPTTITDEDLTNITDEALQGGRRTGDPRSFSGTNIQAAGELPGISTPIEVAQAKGQGVSQDSKIPTANLVQELASIERAMVDRKAVQGDAVRRRIIRQELESRQATQEADASKQGRMFENQDTKDIAKALDVIQKKRATNQATQEEVQLAVALNQELDLRKTNQKLETKEASLFESLPDQKPPTVLGGNVETQAETQTTNDAYDFATKNGAAKSGNFARNLTNESEPEVVAAVLDVLDTKAEKTPVQFMRMARNLGIMDRDGNPRDLTAEIIAEGEKAERLQRVQYETGKGAKAARDQRAKLRKLEEMQRNLNEAETIRAARQSQTAAATGKKGAATVQTAGKETTTRNATRSAANRAKAEKAGVNANPEEIAAAKLKAEEKANGGNRLNISNPGGKWLKKKTAQAFKSRQSADPDTYGANLGAGAAVTAHFEKPVALDPKTLAKFPGAMAEEKRRAKGGRGTKLGRLRSKIKKEGYKPTPILIHVRQDGTPFIVEGNARVAEAAAAGRKSIEAEIRYTLGAEQSEGPLNPKIVEQVIRDNVAKDTGKFSIRERTAGPNTPVLAFSAVQDYVNNLVANWKSPINVAVVRTIEDLPRTARERAEQLGAANEVLGYFSTSTETAYIVSSNLESMAEVRDTLFHEALGHAGLQRLFKESIDSAMMTLYTKNRWLRTQVNDWMDLNPEYFGKGKPARSEIIQSTEEVLARLAELDVVTDQQLSWYDGIVRIIKKWARRLGVSGLFDDANMPEQEVMDILERARDKIVKAGNDRVRMLRDVELFRTTGKSLDNITSKTMEIAERYLSQAQEIAPQDMGPTWRRAILSMSSRDHIAGTYGKLFKNGAFRTLQRAHRYRTALSNRWSQNSLDPHHAFQKLMKKNPRAAEMIVNLMKLTQYNIDPRKNWDQQPWLRDPTNPDEEARIKEYAEEAHRNYRTLRQQKVGHLYDNMLFVNESMAFAQQTMGLFNLVSLDPRTARTILGPYTDPMRHYAEASSLHQQPREARNYWHEQSKNLLTRVKNYNEQQRLAMPSMPKAESDALHDQLTAFEAYVQNIEEQQKSMAEGPYFHLGRFGNYYVAFQLPVVRDANGRYSVPPEVVERISKRFNQKGYFSYELAPSSDRTNVFIRTETQASAQELFDLVKELESEGLVSDAGDGPARGKRTDTRAELSQTAQVWVERLIAEVTTNPSFKPDETMTQEQVAILKRTQRQFIKDVRQFSLDMLPDTSSAKVMVHRDFVPGFTSDMIRSHAFRTQVGAHALANISSSSELMQAFSDMKAAINEARVNGDENVFAMQDGLDEVLKRESQRPDPLGRDFVGVMRAVNHAYFLGLSPAYALTNTTQIGVILWPELAKKHGFKKSFETIARVTPLAFKVVKAAMKMGYSESWGKAAEAVITEEVLQEAMKGTKKDPATAQADIDFMMRMINTGGIELGSQSREHGRIAENKVGSKTELAFRFSSAFGLYSEIFTRLVAALSARELAKKSKTMSGWDQMRRDEYAMNVVNNSMYDYTGDNTARYFGPAGFAGPITPLPMSFLKYSFMTMEKLYRETYQLVKGETQEEKAEARRFMVGHATAVTALAGTLGLPFATVFAWTVEKLVDTFGDDDEPYDAVVAYRNWLAYVVGPDVGEVLARGLPRAFNIDMSVRAGEQDILPGSRMLRDKRAWDEVLSEGALRGMGGSPLSLILNVAKGGDAMMKGNVFKGMTDALPVGLKGYFKAYEMTDRGYVDRSGNVLPMSPSAMDILFQALGLRSGDLGEYQETKFAITIQQGQMKERARSYRQKLAVAVESGDSNTIRELLPEIMQFDAANPAYAVLPGFEQTLRQRKAARDLAVATDTPIGSFTKKTLVLDDGLGKTAYSNY